MWKGRLFIQLGTALLVLSLGLVAAGLLQTGPKSVALEPSAQDTTPAPTPSAPAKPTNPVRTPPPLETLLVQLKASDPIVRHRATLDLSLMHSEAVAAVPALIRLLKDPNPSVRAGAAYALAEIDPRHEGVRQAVAAALRRETEPGVKIRMIGTAGAAGSTEAIPDLLRALKAPDEGVRAEAANALGAVGIVEPRIIDALIKALDDERSPVQQSADWALGVLADPRGQAARMAYYNRIKSMRNAAEAKERLPALMADLRHTDGKRRALAASEIMGFGPEGAEAAPLLLELALEDPVRDVRFSAANAIGGLGEGATRILPNVIEASQSQKAETRLRATLILNRLTTELSEESSIRHALSSALCARLQDSNKNVRYVASEGIMKIDGVEPSFLPAIRKAMDEADMPLLLHLSAALGEAGPEALPYLIPLARHANPQVRYFASFALADAAPDSAEVLRQLEILLEDKNFLVRTGAEGALRSINSLHSQHILENHGKTATRN